LLFITCSDASPLDSPVVSLRRPMESKMVRKPKQSSWNRHRLILQLSAMSQLISQRQGAHASPTVMDACASLQDLCCLVLKQAAVLLTTVK